MVPIAAIPHHAGMTDRSTGYHTPPRRSGPGSTEPVMRRNPDNKMLGGVASGLAHAIEVDTSWVRLGLVVSGLAFGVPVVIAYIAAIFVFPEAQSEADLEPAPPRVAHGLRIGLGVMALLAVLDVLDITDGMRSGPGGFPLGLDTLFGAGLLVAAGAWLVSRRDDPDTWLDDEPTVYRPTPSDVTVDPVTPSTGSPGRGATDLDPPDPMTDSFLEDLYGPLPSRSASAPEAEPRGSGALIALRIVGWIGVLWFVAAALFTSGLWFLGVAQLRWPPLAVALSLFALGVTVFALRTARVARPLAAFLLIGAAAAGIAGMLVDVPGRFGDWQYRPATAADIRPAYEVAAGQFELDLSQTDFTGAARTRTEVHLGIGQLLVTVPPGVRVEVDAEVGAGTLDLGGERKGIGLDEEASLGVTAEGAPVLDLVLRTGLGAIEVGRGGPLLALDTLESGLPILLACSTGETGATSCRHEATPRFLAPELPPLDCWVDGPRSMALCRPVGLIDEIADPWPEDGGRTRCRVPAGGGVIDCSVPELAFTPPAEPETPEAPVPPPADGNTGGERSYLCTERADGSLDCRPAEQAA